MLEHPVGSRLAEWGGLFFFWGGVPKPAKAVFCSVMGCLQSLCYLPAAVKEECGPEKMAQQGKSLLCQCECLGLMLQPHEKARGHGFNPTWGMQRQEVTWSSLASLSKPQVDERVSPTNPGRWHL